MTCMCHVYWELALNCDCHLGPEEEKEAKLTIKDLRKLFRDHRSISFLWRNIAIELGLPLTDIEDIRWNWQGRADDCFKGVLRKWLTEKEATKEKLEAALQLSKCNTCTGGKVLSTETRKRRKSALRSVQQRDPSIQHARGVCCRTIKGNSINTN